VGEIRIFGFNFAPTGWALCQGQTMPISQNTALFSLLGTTYGGNGTSTFQLPDLRGRVPVSFGTGTGLSAYELGQAGGTESVTLTEDQMPAHNHTLQASDDPATNTKPAGRVLGRARDRTFADAPDGTTTMNPGSIASVGGGQPASIVQPYLGLNFCIALFGIFPARS
jgi:microcystin-dependent protein